MEYSYLEFWVFLWMSLSRGNSLIDECEVILKVTAMKNHYKTMLYADFISLETSRMFLNFTKQSRVTWSNSPHVLMSFFKNVHFYTFMSLKLTHINTIQLPKLSPLDISLDIYGKQPAFHCNHIKLN